MRSLGSRQCELVLAADLVNSTVTAADVTGLGFTPAIGTWLVEGFLAVTSAAATTGAQVGLAVPATAALLAYKVETPLTATTDVIVTSAVSGTLNAATSGLTVANLILLTALVRYTSAPAAGLVVPRLASEVAASAVTVKAGSVLRFKKVA